jgi:DNA-binding winged helix-turn-helix (wHTH) protein
MTLSDPRSVSHRRWSFADCIFDECNWTLTVDGRRVAVETKPLQLLRELLLRSGNVVTKDELLGAIWPDVTVVEASLPTAIHKLRLALGDNRRERSIIETVPGIGYRLGVRVELTESCASAEVAASPDADLGAAAGGRALRRMARPVLLVGALALVALLIGFHPWSNSAPPEPGRTYTQTDAANALRRLDVVMIEKMLAAGWDPDAPFDKDGNNAIYYVLGTCEWDHDHDQARLLLVVRTLMDGGASIDRRNAWGDTAYSIAKAPRYCGPNHPVTKSLRAVCYSGYKARGDKCLASYELARRRGTDTISSAATKKSISR